MLKILRQKQKVLSILFLKQQSGYLKSKEQQLIQAHFGHLIETFG